MKHRKLLFALIAVLSPLIHSNAQIFVRVDSVNELKAGDQVIIGHWYIGSFWVLRNKSDAQGVRSSSDTISVRDDTIKDVKTATVFELGGVMDNWTLFDRTNNVYLGVNTSESKLDNVLLSIPPSGINGTNINWKITFERDSGTMSNGSLITPCEKSYTGNFFVRRNSVRTSINFGCYKVSSSRVQLYKKISGPTVTIGSSGYSTLYYGDNALVVPEGLTANTVALEGENIVWSKVYAAGATLPKATGVVLRGASGVYTFELSQLAGESDASNLLRGSDVAERTTGGKCYYFLAIDTTDVTQVGFFWGADNGGAFTNGAHKAYLALPESNSAKFASGFRFDGLTTGILSATSVKQTGYRPGTKRYNPYGQQVDDSYKGLVIINGRKYLNR